MIVERIDLAAVSVTDVKLQGAIYGEMLDLSEVEHRAACARAEALKCALTHRPSPKRFAGTPPNLANGVGIRNPHLVALGTST